MSLVTGQVLNNRYRIAALLSQGGMGDVYRAWDVNLKIQVAIKENLDASPEAQAQFGEEARLLARLSHPNLPRVSDYFTLPGQGEYLVMDYIEGDDLEAILGSHNTLGAGLGLVEAIPWILQVCDALIYLHSQNPPVIHRDIKPANIKVTPTGRAVLVDFGIAKRYDPTHTTLAGARAVTPGYSPPEQYGGAPTDARSDIYSLGATLFHLFTDQQPPESVQRVSGSAGELSPRQVNPAISPTLEGVILKAMAIPMDRRYQNAGELKTALQLLAGPRTAAAAAATAAGIPGQAAASGTLKPRPVPVPVQPLPRRQTTAPPAPKGFLANNWPLLLVGGVVLIFVVMGLGLLARGKASPAAVLPSPSPSQPRPTATSPIDSLVAKGAATQTAAAHLAETRLPPTPAITPTIPVFSRRLYEPFKDISNRLRLFTGIQEYLACWIAGGRYTCQTEKGQASNHFQWLDQTELPGDFVWSADVWPGLARPKGQGDSNAGLLFRASDLGRYLFSVRNDGAFRVSSIQSEPANWIDLIPWTQTPAIRKGEDNRLTVSARGNQYNFFINGQFAASIDSNQWPDGHPGIHLFTAPGEKAMIVEFDNLELRTP